MWPFNKLFESKQVMLHREATNACDQWFWSFWNPKGLYNKTIFVPNHFIRIFSNEDLLRLDYDKLHGKTPSIIDIGGLCSTDAFGTHHLHIVSNQCLNQWTVGHEYQHMLNRIDPSIPNPDLATMKEYYENTK